MRTSETIVRWRQIKEILGAALELRQEDRGDFVAKSCGEDSDLRGEIESLLALESDDFFEDAEISFPEIAGQSIRSFEGRLVGAYRLIREVGAGGMGLVFLAERADQKFEQKIALKLLRRGLDTSAAVRRFELERQILAKLNHPNIARLLDGGTTDDGVPFIVMEYVEGIPIDEYCARHELSLGERLELFRVICGAVSYAHRNLIVHRDLKPDNILVTEEGVPKLLDFGVAKLLSNDEIKATVTRWQAVTPEYASPEQIRGSTITTASDVYNLGIVLYELLTGCRPYHFKTDQPEEIYRVLALEEPLRPSCVCRIREKQNTKGAAIGNDLNSDCGQTGSNKSRVPNPKLLRGDLDNIVLKALRKQPERRYASVEQLSEDLRRYTVGLPVIARPSTFVYRTKKFVSRNRLKVATVAIIFLTMVGGIAGIANQNRLARMEREKAEQRAENLRKISNSLVVEIHDSIRHLPGSLPARKILLQRAAEQLDILAADAGDDPRLQDELATAQFNVGEMYQALGDVARSEEAHQKAVNVYERLLSNEPQKYHYRAQLAKGYIFLGNIFYMQGDTNRTLEFYSRAPQILETASDTAPNDSKAQSDLWEAYFNYAIALARAGKGAESLQISRRTLKIAESLAAPSDCAECRRRLYMSRFIIGTNLVFLGYYEEASGEYDTVSQILAAERAAHPNDSRYVYDTWALERRRAVLEAQTGKLSAADARFQKALEIIEDLTKKNPADAGYRRHASVTLLTFGEALADGGRPSEAVPLLKKAVGLSEKLNAEDAKNGETLGDLAQIYGTLGRALAQTGDLKEALAVQKKSLALFEKAGVKNAMLERSLAATWMQTAKTLLLLSRREPQEAKAYRSEAKSLLEKSIQLWRNLKEKNSLAFADRYRESEVAEQLKSLTND